MGEVYRAKDHRLNRQVALKVLPPAVATDPQRLARSEREAQLLAALNHPNIAAIYGVEESGGTPALVMELVEGETLAERVSRGPIPLDEALLIARQIADALEAAHEQGIIHRDLKPANIKLRGDGAVKVLDFGLAKAMEPAGAVRSASSSLSNSPTITSPAMMTGVGVLLGTAAYMSPEQARGKTVDRRSDIWAFGSIVFEMLTGRPPFSGETVTDVLAAVVTQDPDLSLLPASTPAHVRWVIGRCLQKDPASRFRDAADAAAVLQAQFTPAPVAGRAKWVWPAAVLTIAGVAAGLAGPYVLRGRNSQPPQPIARFDIPTNGASNQVMAMSPDGRQVAFVARGAAEGFAVWVRALDDVEARMLEATQVPRTFMWPAWSPDSRSIAFAADKAIKKVDVRGGAADTIAPLDTQIGGISWSPGGVILFASNDHGLRQVSESGGAVTDVTERDGSLEETYHDCPVFLPDGRHFLYLAYSKTKPENRAVYVGALDSKTRTRLMPSESCVASADPGFIVFARGRTLYARSFDPEALTFTGEPAKIADELSTFSNGEIADFAVASGGGTLVYRKASDPEVARTLVWIDRNGKIGDPIGNPIQPQNGNPVVRLSPDGKHVVFASRSEQAGDDIWTHELERNVRVRLTTDPDVDHGPVWSPDGSRVVFDSHRGGSGSVLYDMPSSGAVPEREFLRVEGTDVIFPSDMSRDGRFVIVMRSPAGLPPWSLWAFPQTGERKPFLYKASATSDNTSAKLSPNGRWLAYATNESGAYQVVVQPFPDPSGGKWQVSTDGGMLPVWRRDGRELYYLTPSGDLVAVAVEAESTFTLGKATTLFRLPVPPDTRGSPYDAAADGQRFLFAVAPRNASTPITAVLNWTSLVASSEK
jgi:eukaryotic-like serine/threonine-protein kinase